MKLDYLIATASTKDELMKRLQAGADNGLALEAEEVVFKLTDTEVMKLANKLSDEGKLVAVFTTDQMNDTKGIIV